MTYPDLFPELRSYIQELENELPEIAPERLSILKDLASYILQSKEEHRLVQLLFVCTHNSRRSHIAQIWAHTFATYFKISDVYCYSGGTESTAFHPNSIASLQSCGFSIETQPAKHNPRQLVRNGHNPHELYCYSKKYDEPPNPEHNFAAVMVCSDADANCPVIPGAEKRISLTYEDPKNYDNSPEEAQMYDFTCRLIGREMLWCFSRVAERIKEVS